MMQRPTQAPLDRETQKKAFESLKSLYVVHEQENLFPINPIIPEKPSEEIFLKMYRNILEERGIKNTQRIVEKNIEEKKTTNTIKQFYCSHSYTPVRASFMGLPMRYKICSKCGIVK
jgi:hypothetical protein